MAATKKIKSAATAKINKFLNKPKTEVLEKVEPKADIALYASAAPSFDQGLRALAATLSDRAITPIKLGETYTLIKNYVKLLGNMEELAKKHLKAIVVASGESPNPESKAKHMVIGDMKFEARPVNTKLDQKKVLAMLTEKSIPLTKGMDEEISYKINESKLAALVVNKKISKDELEACRHELTYSLQPPRKVAEPQPEEARD